MKAFFAVLLAGCALGCATTPAATGAAAKTPRGSEPEIQVPRTVITPQGASNIPELLRDAAALAEQQRWAEAAVAYDRVYKLDTEGTSADEALWGAANAHDRANDLDAAANRFDLLAKHEGQTPRGTQALVRAMRLHVFLGRFETAGNNAELLLKRLDDLNDLAKISVYGARALALLDKDQDEQASTHIERARDIIDRNRLDMASPLERDVAQLYYALGELRRTRAQRITFEPLPPNFPQLLEARCQLLLDAQSAYSDTMRAHDAHWSAMAGYRVAELYQSLHTDLLAVKPPPSADTERKRQLWEGAVRTRYAILLSKAKGIAEHTVAMAERVGEKSDWVERTRATLKSIDQAIKDEEALLAKLQYTKADYDAYIAEQEAAANGKPPKPVTKPAPAKPASPKPAAAPKPAAPAKP